MKSMLPPLAAIFSVTTFTGLRIGDAWPPCPPTQIIYCRKRLRIQTEARSLVKTKRRFDPVF